MLVTLRKAATGAVPNEIQLATVPTILTCRVLLACDDGCDPPVALRTGRSLLTENGALCTLAAPIANAWLLYGRDA